LDGDKKQDAGWQNDEKSVDQTLVKYLRVRFDADNNGDVVYPTCLYTSSTHAVATNYADHGGSTARGPSSPSRFLIRVLQVVAGRKSVEELEHRWTRGNWCCGDEGQIESKETKRRGSEDICRPRSLGHCQYLGTVLR